MRELMQIPNSGPHVVKYLQERVEELEAELADLKATLRELEGEEDWYRLGLTASEMRIFQALRKRKILTTNQLLFALYPNDSGRRSEVDLTIIRVLVSRLRRKIAKAGLTVKCLRNVGWWLESPQAAE